MHLKTGGYHIFTILVSFKFQNRFQETKLDFLKQKN
jgi:hypothetical protein